MPKARTKKTALRVAIEKATAERNRRMAEAMKYWRPPALINEYAGKFGVHCYHGGVSAFLIVRLGAHLDHFMTAYEPLLALDKDSGGVLMRYQWDRIQEEGDLDGSAWIDGGVFVPQLLEVFDDFETAYFYVQGLTRRAA
jgi:hypothetical protein